MVLGKDAWLFINDIFMTRLDFEDLIDPGDVSAATGFFNGDEVEGETIRFQGFTVWSIGE